MENKLADSQATTEIATDRKNEIGLSLIALGLDLFPFLLIMLASIGLGSTSFTLILILLSPIAGLVTGVVSLSRGKKRIGMVGKVISIISIILPPSYVVLFFTVVVPSIVISM